MKINSIETFCCDAGWRPWIFIKIATDDGIVGWSECTDSHGSPNGIMGVVSDLTPLLINEDPRATEKIFWKLFSRTRQSPGSIIQKAIGGIENALLDIKAKALGIPVYELFGGPVRETVPVYWSHCVTSRVRAWDKIGVPPVKSFEDINTFCKEINRSGYKAIKTNIPLFENDACIYMPGFARSFGGPELNPDRKVLTQIEKYIGTLRDAIDDDIEIILDLNFNFKTEGYIRIGHLLDNFNLMWLEIDSYDPGALLQIKQKIKTPICSGENLYGARGFRSYFEQHAMDIASVDVIWNGFFQSKKISDIAEIYEINVTPHNYYSHLATLISAHFCFAIPNIRILETDVDDVPWKDDLVTEIPHIENGLLHLPKLPGWGTSVNMEVLNEHPWK